MIKSYEPFLACFEMSDVEGFQVVTAYTVIFNEEPCGRSGVYLLAGWLAGRQGSFFNVCSA